MVIYAHHRMDTNNDQSLLPYIHIFQTFSLIISAAIEILGYSYTAIKQRQTSYATLVQGDDYVVGSKGEGISLVNDSDTDNMYVLPEVLCADAVVDGCQLPLLVEMDELHPGYTKLKVPFPDKLIGVSDVFFKSCFKTNEGNVYLSSLLFTGSLSKIHFHGKMTKITGPSICTFDPNTHRSMDIVLAIRYKSTMLLQEWLARPRFHGWPSEDTLREIAKLDWHLVPVGPKQAEDFYQLWRICFTLGELYLVKTFNIAQLHLLILLKYVIRKSLKPMSSIFSSYMAKNLVFWMVEILPPKNFKSDNVCSLMMIAIQILRLAVENDQLNNYMIPSRNLFRDKKSPYDKNQIIHILDKFIEDGPGFIMKHSEFFQLREAMQRVNSYPEFVRRELKKENRTEKERMNFIAFIKEALDDGCKTDHTENHELKKEWVDAKTREFLHIKGLNPIDMYEPFPGLF